MADNDNTIITFGIGVIVGGLFAFIILKSRPVQPATLGMSQPQTPQYIQPMFIQAYPQYAPQYVPPPYSPLSQVPSPTVQPTLAAQQTPAPLLVTQTKPGLQNEEEWVVKKDKRGRLEGITVHRKVTPVG